MSSKKVLIYILSEGKGGVEEYVMNLSRYSKGSANRYGYLIMGRTTVYEEELKRLGVEYFFVPSKRHVVANIITYRKIFKKLRDSYNAIYFNTSGLYYAIPYLFAVIYGYRIILHSHSTSGKKIKSFIHMFNRWWIMKFVSVRLACSKPAGEWMFGNKQSFDIIPNAVDLDRFKFCMQNRIDCRKKYGVDDYYLIGTIGRLHWGKNQVFLVEILKELLKKNVDAKLIIVGEGEMKEQIIAKAEELGVAQRVIFTGQKDSTEMYYSAMDCFLLPSFAEGFPVTLVEAQANGIPCIVSDRVTRETNISGNIKFLSLDSSPLLWAEEVMNNRERYDCMNKLNDMGYNVKKLDGLVWNYLNI